MRVQVEREIDRLLRDFDKLPNVPCCVRIERSTIFSRYPKRRNVPTKPGRIRSHAVAGVGLEFPPVPVRKFEDLSKASVFYDISGRPLVTANGEPLLVCPGWKHSYLLQIKSSNSETEFVRRTLGRASDWAKNRWGILKPLLFPETIVLNNGSMLWVDVVFATALRSESATLRHMKRYWVQTQPLHRVELGAWRNRHSFGLSEEIAVEDMIGDDPEDVFVETESLIEDSFEVLDYLKREVTGRLQGDPPTELPATTIGSKDNELTICREAFRAVVEGDLAGVLRAADKVPSREKVSEDMRKQLAADPSPPDRYQWSAEKWSQVLGCSKPTIIGNSKQGIPPCEAWAEIMAWRESNKQNRFPKKPKEKD